MDKNEPNSNLLSELSANPPKVIGGYKKQGWAIKVLENTSNLSVEKEDGGKVTAKAVLEANDKTYYPAFITLDLTKKESFPALT
ncbi:hypothetical protein [Cytobacillus firmus]|uniref:hypothetical protein n=1 Tax=Cytobacillus firmus TaxID=1399 RepID=UPI00351A04EC